MYTKNDKQKLLQAGYVFIREDKATLTIKIQKNGQYTGGWSTLEKGFTTRRSLRSRMDELLVDDKTLEM